MRAIDIYQMDCEESIKQLGYLKNHINEIEESDLWGIPEETNKMVGIQIHKYHNFDGRRYWQLGSVWFNGSPVMIIQNAGREGEDHEKKFITNKQLYIDMVRYIKSLIPFDDEWIDKEFINEEDDVKELNTFYGYSLNGRFERW